MKRASVVTLAVACLLSQIVLAQGAPQMPKPGPEHKRLNYFVGKWTGAGDSKESPFGPAGKFTFSESNQWFPGGFFVVTHSDYKGPMGTAKGLAEIGYDSEAKAYTYHAIDSMGFEISAKGQVEGDTWTWQSESTMGGKPVKSRFTIKELSPTSYTMKFEMPDEKGAFQTISEGKATKAGGGKGAAASKPAKAK
jgi:hypothetical protein